MLDGEVCRDEQTENAQAERGGWQPARHRRAAVGLLPSRHGQALRLLRSRQVPCTHQGTCTTTEARRPLFKKAAIVIYRTEEESLQIPISLSGFGQALSALN